MTKALPESVEAVAAVTPLTAAAREKLALYAALLRKWQASQNLVSPATLPVLWTRHMADSAQALAALPEARRWVDLGSGAGFPGLVTAILLADTPGAVVHLVESNAGKAAFLRTVARETGAPAVIHVERIERFVEHFDERVDAVSARALAPMARLVALAAPLIARGATGVFHKGQDFASELQEATQSWILDLIERASRIEAGSRIILVRGVVPATSPGGPRP
jgi:16S rRNA (guanine527-N7)-methyltransferase